MITPYSTIDVINIVPLRGPAGIFAPACEAATQLAVDELNSGRGILGREVQVTLVDGGRPPAEVAREVEALLATGMVDAITGWHLSSVRRAVSAANDGRVPYVYPTCNEGNDRTPGLVMAGEHPGTQVVNSVRWLTREHSLRRWAVVGNEYNWPHDCARYAHQAMRELEADIVTSHFVPLGTRDFGAVFADPQVVDADAVLLLLVGNDAIAFNRAHHELGLSDRQIRFSPSIEENILLGAPESNRNLYAAAGYFPGRTDADPMFWSRYHHDDRLRPTMSTMGESCYEGLMTIAGLAAAADSLAVPAMMAAMDDGLTLSGPRGELTFAGNQLNQPIYLARAVDVDFEVVAKL